MRVSGIVGGRLDRSLQERLHRLERRGALDVVEIGAADPAAAALPRDEPGRSHGRYCRGRPAALGVRLSLARGSLLAYAPDPLVLFPGAAVRVTLGPGAAAVCQDGFACHDPGGGPAPFDLGAEGARFNLIQAEAVIRGRDGGLCVTDRGLAAGAMLGTAASPLGPSRAAGNVFLLAPDGGRLSLALALATQACFRAVSGVDPAPRRK